MHEGGPGDEIVDSRKMEVNGVQVVVYTDESGHQFLMPGSERIYVEVVDGQLYQINYETETGPWLEGPYDGPDATSWDNAKAHMNSIDRFFKGPQGLTNLITVTLPNFLELVLWNRLALPPATPGLEHVNSRMPGKQIGSR